MIKNICTICFKEFTRPHNPNKKFKYCSCICMGEDKVKNLIHSKKMKGKKAWNKGDKGIKEWHNISGLNSKNGTPWNKGKTGIFSKEALESNRQKHLGKIPTNKGIPMSQEQKEKLSAINIGTHRSEATKSKISNTMKKIWHNTGRNIPRGIKHHNWKGGISKENDIIRHSIEGNLWRNSVFAKDGYICQKYGIKGGKLEAHHILNFSSHKEFRFAIDNGITLSKEAHKEFHKIYGKKNNTREQLDEFLTDSVDNKWACEASSSRA